MRLIADLAGERLDAFLARSELGLSRSAVQKLMEEGCVRLGGRPGKKNDRLNVGDLVEVTIPEPKAVDVAPREMPLDIVYEDADVVVINKPKGLVVHPAAGHQDDTLVNGLLYAMGDSLSGINGELRPGIVHRIDKDTSGLLAVAKNDLAHAVLASQLKDHTMARTYEAIVCGNLKEDRGTVDAPIGRHPTDRKRMCVTERNSKPAVTHWEVVKRYRGYTHIRCRLETGRTHQIRVHMAYIGHPILGDTVYGHKKPELGQDSQCLHAGALCFRHPRDGRPVMVFAPLPAYFQQVLEKLEKMQ
ncbi:MAG: RluA family pseudouridine synthase [Candidatus Faecousia sp.]|nr:RluA family pseudouridine synthase [Bacillota bacterium]MDY4753943.1 RluA family pseudouridine synthase [Candidatus Faecousia sp.]MDY6159613.1 RluA family pseudouridine synthase [Candidatus Faecousia sp.]